MGRANPAPALLPGTLDLLILQAVGRGSMHGYGIALYLKTLSDDVLQVGEGSLSRAATPDAEWLGESGMGRVGEQPARAFLHSHRCRPEATRARNGRVRPDVVAIRKVLTA